MLLPHNTCIYLLIHTNTIACLHIPHTPNLEPPYLGNQSAVRHEPKSRCNNHPFTTYCAGLWYMECIRHNMRAC